MKDDNERRERWATIECAPDYEVSDEGRVRSKGFVTKFGSATKKHKPRLLKPWISEGYPTVSLRTQDGPLKKRVHRLVAEAFVDNPEDRGHVNHIDGKRTNASFRNLEWVTPSENAFHRTRVLRKGLGQENGSSKLTEDDVREIRSAEGRLADIAEIYGVDKMQVSRIKRRKTWAHVE